MNLKRYLVVVLCGLVVLLTAGLQIKSYAVDLFPACDSSTGDSTVCQNKNQTETHTANSFYGPNGIFTKVVKLYSIITGVAAVIIIIISGFKFVTASGDPNNVKSAKNTLLFAIVGLVVAALGATIAQFVLSKL